MVDIKTNASEFESSNYLEMGLIETYPNIKWNNLTYLDIGAGLPEFYSNSLHFRNKGVKIISVDANPRFCNMHTECGYDIHNYAIVTDDRKEVSFIEYPGEIEGLAFSSIDESGPIHGLHSIKHTVNSITVNEFLKKYYSKIKKIDIIDLDIEGSELEIIQSLDLKKLGVKGMIIENLNSSEENYRVYEMLGYFVYAKCAHNDILIKKQK
jgi:FkbM family methyltransferase